jgi:tRNA-binding protein
MGAFKPAAVKPVIPFLVLDSVDIRAGTIRSVENVAASRKLVKLTVSFGDHTRQILAGLRTERSDPQQLVGVQTLFVVNLEPRNMAGEVSEGMLFDIGYSDRLTPALVLLEHPLPDGSRAG